MNTSPFNHKVLTQRLSFIGRIHLYLPVLEELGIVDKGDNTLEMKIKRRIGLFESKGYSLAGGHFGNEVRTPSGWHFNIYGINNLINSKLVLGDNFQYEAFRAYDYLRLKGLHAFLFES